MFTKQILVLIVIGYFSAPALAWDASLGFYKSQDKIQDTSGKATTPNFSPSLAIGHQFTIFGLKASPQLGYIYHLIDHNDSYGGEYTMQSFYLLYDFIYSPGWDPRFSFRWGLGNFIRRISGDGGPVEVPNGSTTSTDYRPGKASNSLSMSLNLGFDYLFSTPMMDAFDSGFGGEGLRWGLRGSFFLFEIFETDKTTWSYQLALTGYF